MDMSTLSTFWKREIFICYENQRQTSIRYNSADRVYIPLRHSELTFQPCVLQRFSASSDIQWNAGQITLADDHMHVPRFLCVHLYIWWNQWSDKLYQIMVLTRYYNKLDYSAITMVSELQNNGICEWPGAYAYRDNLA